MWKSDVEEYRKEHVSRRQINPVSADEIVKKIHHVVFRQKRFKNRNFSITQLAEELSVPVYAISTVLNKHLGMNFTSYVNQFRVKEAMKMLRNKRYRELNMEDIGAMAGFSTRQSFYMVFSKMNNVSPHRYQTDYFKHHLMVERKKEVEVECLKKKRK